MRVRTWRKYPILLLGYDVEKWEIVGGEPIWFSENQGTFRFFYGRNDSGPSHLQYRSPFGFLLTWPLCLHVWYQFKGQDTYIDGNGVTMTKPGTEKVLYWRCGARWDAHDGFYETPSWYGPGLHWD